MEGKRKPRSEEDVLREYEARQRQRKPRSEEDVLREYEARQRRTAAGPLGEPAIPVEKTSYGSLREFQKTKTNRGGRKRANQKTRRRARRGGRRI